MKHLKKNNMKLVDYINHPTFISIEDKGTEYVLLMNSIKDNDKYKSLNGYFVDSITYMISFYKEEPKVYY